MSGRSSIINGACTDIERQNQQQSIAAKEDDTTDLLPKPKQRLSVNHLQRQTDRRSSSNSAISNENPWKKMNSVRYKLEKQDAPKKNPSHYSHAYEQHISYV